MKKLLFAIVLFMLGYHHAQWDHSTRFSSLTAFVSSDEKN